MKIVRTKAEVRREVSKARSSGRSIGLVPTMGYLHAGHLSLVERARERASWVAMSIFVNPLQFGPGEDLDRYPRDLERDEEMARERGVDLLFLPTVEEMYPDGGPWVRVVPEQGADRLCGAARPGHFHGVLTVVAKLFGIFAPDVAVFGQKDYQQAELIRRMVRDLDFPISVDVAPVVREADGLAMSSRNSYLSPEERRRARALSRALERCRELFDLSERDSAVLRAAMRDLMEASGVQVEYVEVIDGATLEPLDRARAGAVCAVAGRVGRTRLIDNLVLSTSD